MKKFFLFAAAVVAAMTINAQDEKKIIVVEDYCNYINFQGVASSTTVPTSAEDTWYTFANGTVCKGFKKSDGSEAGNSWNVKATSTANSFPMPDEAAIDSVQWGTVFRAASGSSVVLGDFNLAKAGSVEVFFQPNGTSDRGLTIAYGDQVTEFRKTYSNKNEGYKVVLNLEAGSYDAGDVVITVVGNTINIAGVNIVGLPAQGVENVDAADKAVKTFENGQLVIIKNGVKYNALGAKF